MVRRTLGIYLHIPFCLKKCNYCDFCSFGGQGGGNIEAYVEELCRRVEQKATDAEHHTVDTVYFGGGTPTLLTASQLERLLVSVRGSFVLSPDCEITCECNPATADREKLAAFRRLGINRLSIGLQSAHASELRALGRAYSYEEFRRTFSDARAAGFDNISVDLMYGIPHQTVESFGESLSAILELCPEHVSAYGLKIEEGTPFWHCRESLPLPDEEAECEMYRLLGQTLARAGYEKYEISNFAKKGYASRHNLKYWHGEEYLGFGVAAHSFFGGERIGNSRDMEAFLRGEEIIAERVTVSPEEEKNEYIMLRMRLAEGICHEDYRQRFGMDFCEEFREILSRYVPLGLLRSDEHRTAFEEKGFLLSNLVLSEMTDFS